MQNSSKHIVLQFSDLKTLWAFTQELSTKQITITTWNKTLFFKGTESELTLALTTYNAKIYNGMEFQSGQHSQLA